MPDAYATIEARLDDIGRKNNLRIVAIETEITRRRSQLTASRPRSTGRQKQPYSVWRKMERKSISFEQMSDIFGFRILVGTPRPSAIGRSACCTPNGRPCRAASRITSRRRSPTITARSTPPWSGLVGSASRLQVRTEAMHDIASNGIAAHVLYKEGRGARPRETLTSESKAFQWLRRTIESLAEGSSPEEFLEHTKLELFLDQVFCFTPNGRSDRVAAVARRRSTSPMPFTRTSATPQSVPRSTGARRRR